MATQPQNSNSAASRSARIRTYLTVIRRYAWFALLVLVASIGITFLLTQRQDRVYTSSARVLLRTGSTFAQFPYSNTAPREYLRIPENEQLFAQTKDFRDLARESSPSGVSVAVRARGNELVFTGQGTVPEDIAAATTIWAELYVQQQRIDFENQIVEDIDFLEQTINDLQAERAIIRREVAEIEALMEQTEDTEQYSRLLTQKVSIETLLQPQLNPIDQQIGSFRQEQAGLESLTRFFDEPEASARVEAAAPVPTDPISPNVLRNLIFGGLLGLALGVGLPYFHHLVSDKVDDSDDVEDTTQLPILGTIPAFKHGRVPTIEVLERPASVASERYRAVLTAIEFAAIGEPISSILITSPSAGAGKTTTAVNLASLAARYKNVILVDADMRRPTVHHYVQLPNDLGLTDVLTGQADFADARQTFSDEGVRFDVLLSGPMPQDPELLLRSKAWARLIDDLFLYDLIIVDAPPVLAVTDPVLAGRATDGQILLSRAGVTKRHELAEATEVLASNGARSLGVVVNHEKATSSSYSYYGEYAAQS